MTEWEKQRLIDRKLAEAKAQIVKEIEEQEWPQRGDKVFWISSQGFIKGATYRNDEQWKNRLGFLGLYRTQAEAETRKRGVTTATRNLY